MSNPNEKLALAAGGVALAVTIQRLMKWRGENASRVFSEQYPRPSSGAADWMSPEEYAVFIALCDTFCPEEEEDQVGLAIGRMNLPKALLDLCSPQEGMDILKAGALKKNVHSKILDIFANTSTETDKADLKTLFWLLSSTAGCLALTGMPAPFHGLSLANRVTCILRFQNSFLTELRVAYQTLKRLVMSVFMDSLTEEGEGC